MIALRRRRRGDDDGGFALIFVMLVTTMIMAAVATTMYVTTPNIVASKSDQDTTAALAAAQAGVDDVVAYLTSVPACRSTTKVCSQALGAASSVLGRSFRSGTDQTFSWTTDSALTADDYVRVHSTGTSGGVSRTVTADLSLAPSILSFGYYTDYESQSPTFLYDYFSPRTIKITDSNVYSKISTTRVTAPTQVQWAGPAKSGSNPYPASVCGQHWYYDSPTSPGRYTYGNTTSWGETGSINNVNTTRTASCDVVFTTGMTEDGPIYTRDAMLISDGTYGGVGPIFKAPVYTLWGFHGYSTPTPSATPWRRDATVGGAISSTSPYSPQTAGLDLQLPDDIGTAGLPDDYCVYYGPTRVHLNGDGTATITSPSTKTRNSASDPNCYPTTSLASGIVNFKVDYGSVGHGVIYTKNLGTAPSAGWPDNGTKSTNTPAASNSVLWVPATSGGSSAADPDTSKADDTCSSAYSTAVTANCAWTGVRSATDGASSSTGWTTYTAAACSGPPAATNRQLFECEYAHKTSGTPAVTQSGGSYDALRTDLQGDLAGGSCLTGTAATQLSCVATLLNGDLATANTSSHRYIVTTQSAGSVVNGAKSIGSAPNNPMSGDSLFSYSGTPAQETVKNTPLTYTVSRQTYSNGNWGSSVPQFTLTVTQTDNTLSSPATGAAYFPDTNDVTDYNTGATAAGTAGGSLAPNQPGDLYVDGDDQGKLSLIAQNDVEVTDDMQGTSSPATDSAGQPVDAVDIVAGGNVRNYHPVSCVDQTAADINATAAGWCPNDISGLYNSILESNGTLYSTHPAMQYVNMTNPGSRTIDAAIFSLSGSFLTDNYNRGVALGTLQVNGGVYQSHRGANGTQWETQYGETKRASSGYSLNYHYIDLEHANLPYAPPATGGSTTRVWNVVSISGSS